MLDKANRQRLTNTGTVIYLRTTIAEQRRRTQLTRNRPLLMTDNPEAVLEQLMVTRNPLYEEVADISVDTTGRQVRSVTASVRKLLEQQLGSTLQK